MSSHHVVREKQEPALLVLSLEHITDDELGQLLEWSPTVIAPPAIAEQLDVYDIKIDYVIADEGMVISQSDVRVIVNDGWPLLQTGLHFLISQGYPAVNIIADEFDLNTYQTYAGQIDFVVFFDQKKIYPIASGFSKWKPANEIIEIVGPEVEMLEEGLAPLTHNQYKTTRDGFFKIQFSEPCLFIAEAY
ncbi:thiamine pyrophosphokinase [Mucilaginibacter sp. Bleaf8]|uniref:thiamine pyrophosphokinase n=1 Tax=Mucilaginibacter sp. Bleaf8 TaxID=2834430 RepID=UPI001BD00F6B|nr:thiamine pyrophosphokinase [Mucilaginibacter sp. Bleaf8]MBS7564449.1 thiamine pyrophosphokinase [Mucilaginibacter sp. Bleaf8]